MTLINDGSYVCSRCLSDDYLLCNECDEYFLADEVSLAVDAHGNSVYVCDDCRDKDYSRCSECDELFHNDSIEDDICPNCRAEEVPA